MTIAENDEIVSNASDTAKALNRLFRISPLLNTKSNSFADYVNGQV